MNRAKGIFESDEIKDFKMERLRWIMGSQWNNKVLIRGKSESEMQEEKQRSGLGNFWKRVTSQGLRKLLEARKDEARGLP